MDDVKFDECVYEISKAIRSARGYDGDADELVDILHDMAYEYEQKHFKVQE